MAVKERKKIRRSVRNPLKNQPLTKLAKSRLGEAILEGIQNLKDGDVIVVEQKNIRRDLELLLK